MSVMSLKGKRIFIVEDDVANKTIIVMLLEQQGAVTAIDRFGRQVLEKLKAFGPVDVILMDLMLPNNVSGFDLFDVVRSDPEYSDVPIVAVSAMEPAVAVPRAKAKGFAGFISKPVEYDLFPRQIAQVIERQAVWQWLPQ
ncbi:MAG: response regulator [Anaerolineae bacterium]|nr:response regulator [Anaerolineae bacterium]